MTVSIGRLRAKRLAGATAALVALVGIFATPASAEPPSRIEVVPVLRHIPSTLRVVSPHQHAGTVFLHWEGTIAAPMADQIDTAFQAFASTRRRFVLFLNTGGGSVLEGEKVIAVLQKIKRTHQLDTSVSQGSRCGSMCIPVYLQGRSRFAGRSSSWLFHEVTRPGAQYGSTKRVAESYRRLIDKYWVPAGVSQTWIERMLVETNNHDWWQTGNDLIADKAGIITHALENRRPRNLEADMPTTTPGAAVAAPPGKAPRPSASVQPSPPAPSIANPPPKEAATVPPSQGEGPAAPPASPSEARKSAP